MYIAVLYRWLITLVPIAIAAGRGAADVAFTTAAVLFVIDQAVIEKNFKPFKEKWFMASMVFWVYLLIRNVFSDNIMSSMVHALPFIRYPLFALAFQKTLSEIKWQKRIFLVTTATVIFLALDSYFQFFIGIDVLGKHKIDYRLTGPLSKPVIGSVIATLCIPLVAYLAHDLTFIKRRVWLSIAIIALIWSIIFFTGERAPFLRMSAGIGLLTLLAIKTDLKKLGLLLVAAVIIPVALYQAFDSKDIIQRQFSSTIDTIQNFKQSVYGKLWISGTKIGIENPVFGTGLKHYQSYCQQNSVTDFCGDHPHNIYIELFTESGIVGLVLFLTMFYFIGATYYPLPDFAKNPVLTGVLIGILFTIFPFLSSMGFFQNSYAVPLWFMLGWGLSLKATKEEFKI